MVGHSWGSIVALSLAVRHQADTAGLVLLSGYYFWTLRPDVLLVTTGAIPLLGDILRHTVSPWLGRLLMPLQKRAMFSPAPVPNRFRREYSDEMALRPSQIRATSLDGILMIPGALGLRRHYADLQMPVLILAGDGDKIVWKRSAERLHAAIPGSVLRIVEGAGHMVHHSAPEQVVEAIQVIAGMSAKVPAEAPPVAPVPFRVVSEGPAQAA
ncbi:Alpha/beta hydrolase family protein [Belnapia rosea]|uniref:Alpha/beta hydrolase family protein n=1 Tax=Belnapia rosea TaxID=938405 RepID=A0A1G7D088_9PROT|nr:alpha/beta hydrolase [Belnapia rosea]SDE44978.1 Alpha/beta hydrolase family protein [Belnapia rosea]